MKGDSDERGSRAEAACTKLANRAIICGCCVLVSVIVFICLGVAAAPPLIQSDFAGFMQIDAHAQLLLNAFSAARSSRNLASRRLQAEAYTTKDLFLAYEVRDSDANILEKEELREITGFEASLLSLPKWQELCGRTEELQRRLCDMGISYPRYVRPSLERGESEVVPDSLILDGLGKHSQPLALAEHLAKSYGLDRLLWPENFQPALGSAKMLRSAFRFQIPVSSENTSAIENEWRELVVMSILPLIRRANAEKAPEKNLYIWYGGSDINSIEFDLALQESFSFAGASMAFVIAYLLFHTRSLLLSSLGPALAFLSVPLTYVLCSLLFGLRTVSFANFLSLFLVVGFGADVLFVITDYWYDACLECEDRLDRLALTYRRALPATFATTGTTSLSFLANLLSVSRALREFGFFMGICVLISWLLMVLIYVPLCVLDTEYLGRIRLMSSREASVAAEGRKSRYYSMWTSHLYKWRLLYIILYVAALGAFLGYSIPNVKVNTSFTIFPERHNQNYGKTVLAEFVEASDVFRSNMPAPPSTARVCNESVTGACDVHWCEAEAIDTDVRGCSCFERRQASNASECSRQSIGLLKVAGNVEVWELRTTLMSAGIIDNTMIGPEVMAPIVLQEWTTGVKDVARWQQYKFWTSKCVVAYTCFCGTAAQCQMDGQTWQRLPRAPMPQRRLATTWRVPYAQQANLAVIFGLKVSTAISFVGSIDADKRWSYDERFDMKDPWMQRHMLRFCEELPEELLIAETFCWMSEFAEDLLQRGLRFPALASTFDADAYAFSSRGALWGEYFLWLEDSKLKALYYQFKVDLERTQASRARTESLKSKWDKYVADWNAVLKADKPDEWDTPQSSWNVRGAWHFSISWIEIERQVAATESLILTSAIILGLAFCGMFVFTRSFVLSFFVLLSTAGVMTGLLFFIVLMSWDIGFVEVIAIVYFAGYAVTYSLHIAHKYASYEALVRESEDPTLPVPSERSPSWRSRWQVRLRLLTRSDRAKLRIQRTFFAFTSIGWATIGSAVTTAGASAFLIPCTLVLFQKLGSMCLAVVLASAATAQVALPIMLMLCGPSRPGHCSCEATQKPAASEARQDASSPEGGPAAESTPNEPEVDEREGELLTEAV